MKGISSFISLALAAVVAALPSPVPQQGGNVRVLHANIRWLMANEVQNGGSGQFAPAVRNLI